MAAKRIAVVAGGFPRDRLIVVEAGGVAGTIAGLAGALSRARALDFDVMFGPICRLL